ncbi:MAG: hypothetical protein JO239_07445 [Paraburkholderia sp.]|nr:hypothetical protein [Paraburkholderia sp.]
MPNLAETAASSIGVLPLPSNHSTEVAQVLDPRLRTGLAAMLCAAAAWLVRESEVV